VSTCNVDFFLFTDNYCFLSCFYCTDGKALPQGPPPPPAKDSTSQPSHFAYTEEVIFTPSFARYRAELLMTLAGELGELLNDDDTCSEDATAAASMKIFRIPEVLPANLKMVVKVSFLTFDVDFKTHFQHTMLTSKHIFNTRC
jgi:hypothetical protein